MHSLYKELARYYDLVVAPFVETETETDFLEKVLREHGAKSVLDIACGTGRHAIPLSRRGFRVTGIDSSRAMVRIAKEKARRQKSKAQFLTRDCAKIGLRNAFDAAYCMWNSFYILPHRSMLKSLRKALKEGGVFVIDGKDWTKTRKNLHGKTQRMWENSLEKGKTRVGILRTDTFTGTRRMVQVEYAINGKRFVTRDVGETIPLSSLEKMLGRHGFEVIKSCREFGKRGKDADSVQIIAKKV